MARQKRQPEPPPEPPKATVTADDLGLADFFKEPDDQGLSLEELGQTYAALLGASDAQALDPYPDPEVDRASDITEEDPEAGPLAGEAPARVLDGDDDAACEITPRSILEAILFVGHPQNEPLTSKQISSIMRGVRPDEIDDLVLDLNQQYADEGAPYQVVSIGAGYVLTVAEAFAPLRDRFYGRVKEARLTQPAIDCLAIVAYNQPISLDEIDRIRARPSSGILSQLVRRDLLAIQRPAEKKGSPRYSTTPRFLQLFGLENLADLPQVERNL